MNITLSASIPPILILVILDWLTGGGLSGTTFGVLAVASFLLNKSSKK